MNCELNRPSKEIVILILTDCVIINIIRNIHTVLDINQNTINRTS